MILKKIHEELVLIRKELQKIREILEFAFLPQYRVEVKEGKHIKVPLNRKAALKELRK